MTKPLPRTGFNSPRLIRLLADMVGDGAVESKTSFAERLGQWLGFTDAIALSAALHPTGRAAGQAPAAAQPDALAPAVDACRVEAALRDAILSGSAPGPGRARVRLPVATAARGAVDFLPYHRYYAAQQREMEVAAGALRARVRAALQGGNAALAQLAALDAVLERSLAERERDLLANVPSLLEVRFRRRVAKAQEAAEALTPAAGEGGRGDGDAVPDAGLQRELEGFARDLQQVLLAELEFRLQPVMALLDAAGDGSVAEGDRMISQEVLQG